MKGNRLKIPTTPGMTSFLAGGPFSRIKHEQNIKFCVHIGHIVQERSVVECDR